MDYEGDVLELVLEKGLPGTIDELMNNISTENNNINNGDRLPADIGTSNGGEADVDTNNKDIQEEEYDEIVERFKKQFVMNSSDDHVGLDAAISIPADNHARDKRDTILTPMKTRKKPSRWTKEEHRQLKIALNKGMKGKWKEISRLHIPSKTPAQITSHAQKYSKRLNNTHKKRKSINDDNPDDDDDDANDMSSSYKAPSIVLPPTEIPDHVNTLHQQLQVVNYDPSSMVNQISPLQVQYPSPMLMSPPQHMPMPMMNMASPPPYHPYDDITLYYIDHYLRLEKQLEMMMLKYMHDMAMTPPISAGASSNGYNNDVGSSSSSNFAGNTYATTNTPTHDASYYNGHIDQWVQPPAAEPLVQYDEQIGHVVLPPAGQLGRQYPTNHT